MLALRATCIRRVAEQPTRMLQPWHCATSWPTYLHCLKLTNSTCQKSPIHVPKADIHFQGGIFTMWLFSSTPRQKETAIFVKIGIYLHYHCVSCSTVIRRGADQSGKSETNSQTFHNMHQNGPSLYFISKAQRCSSRFVSSVPGWGWSTGFNLMGT